MPGLASFDSTVSGASANSYLTRDEADALTAEYDCADAWDSLPLQEDKDRLLLKAARAIDRYRSEAGGWGVPKVEGQRLAFPREVDAADVIPEGVKRAVLEIVNAALVTAIDELKRQQAEGVTSFSALGQSTSITADESLLCAEARKELDLLARQVQPVQTIRPKIQGQEQSLFFED